MVKNAVIKEKTMFRFEELDIWKEAILYSKNIYKITEEFPKSEIFGLTSQLKRSAISISSNIAEGIGSITVKGFSNYLDIAIKSALESVSQILFAKEMGYVDQQTSEELYNEAEILIKRMHRFKRSLKEPRATSYVPRAVNI